MSESAGGKGEAERLRDASEETYTKERAGTRRVGTRSDGRERKMTGSNLQKGHQ